MRSEFEKLDGVKDRLSLCYFLPNGNKYIPYRQFEYASASYLNGAWSAWQHQQTKVDELQKRVDAFAQLLEKHIADLGKTYLDDKDNKFEYWRGFAECAQVSKKMLEQTLKGGEG
ncbi:MAG: hypothetical protein RSC05_04390 [Acinetobacter sp.]